MVDWVKQFIVAGGYGGGLLRAEHEDSDIPAQPTVSYIGAPNMSIDRLVFRASEFQDPQGADSFQAMQWRRRGSYLARCADL